MDERPALARAPVAGLHICILSFHGKARIKGEVKQGFILEIDRNGVVFAGGIDFGVVNRLALNFFKAMKFAMAITADCNFIALVTRVVSGQWQLLTAAFPSGRRETATCSKNCCDADFSAFA